jgi:Gas vesicle synthesis protein GvpL/GvpF
MTDPATYLYAITRPIPPVAVVGLRGIGGGAVRAIPAGDLTCVASSVDPGEFDEESMSRNLDSLAWLERAAREHDDVVQAVAALATAVPLRLATICRDDVSAVQQVRARAHEAASLLAHLDGHEEWGVKLFDASERPAANSTIGSGPGSSGTAYLLRRRAELASRAEAAARSAEQADEVFDRLAALATQARRHRLQDRQLSGAASPMLLNAAFLVDRTRLAEFHEAVDQLAAARPGGAVQSTGPWPAYSFANLDGS